jgi:hypothetical protein
MVLIAIIWSQADLITSYIAEGTTIFVRQSEAQSFTFSFDVLELLDQKQRDALLNYQVCLWVALG